MHSCKRTKLKLNPKFLTKPTLLISGGVKSKLQPGTSILLNINYLSSGAGARIRVPLKSRLTYGKVLQNCKELRNNWPNLPFMWVIYKNEYWIWSGHGLVVRYWVWGFSFSHSLIFKLKVHLHPCGLVFAESSCVPWPFIRCLWRSKLQRNSIQMDNVGKWLYLNVYTSLNTCVSRHLH